MQEDWRIRIVKTLAMREMITPADLPPFGALVATTSGHLAEIVAWFDRDKNRIGEFADQRVAFALVCVDGMADGMRPAIVTETQVLKCAAQPWPRFARWLIEAILAAKTGEGTLALRELN